MENTLACACTSHYSRNGRACLDVWRSVERGKRVGPWSPLGRAVRSERYVGSTKNLYLTCARQKACRLSALANGVYHNHVCWAYVPIHGHCRTLRQDGDIKVGYIVTRLVARLGDLHRVKVSPLVVSLLDLLHEGSDVADVLRSAAAKK